MWFFIGTAVVLAFVVALFVRASRRSARAGGLGNDVDRSARGAKLSAQEQATRWGAGS
jgi:hypothetical protein